MKQWSLLPSATGSKVSSTESKLWVRVLIGCFCGEVRLCVCVCVSASRTLALCWFAVWAIPIRTAQCSCRGGGWRAPAPVVFACESRKEKRAPASNGYAHTHVYIYIYIYIKYRRTWMGLPVSTVVEAMAMNMPCAATMCAYETTAT
jgi:hypothetical protein